jgi:hypothetical protein
VHIIDIPEISVNECVDAELCTVCDNFMDLNFQGTIYLIISCNACNVLS